MDLPGDDRRGQGRGLVWVIKAHDLPRSDGVLGRPPPGSRDGDTSRRAKRLGQAGTAPAQLRRACTASRTFGVGIIGGGPQGIAQGEGLQAVRGVEVAGITDINPARLGSAPDPARTAGERLLRRCGPTPGENRPLSTWSAWRRPLQRMSPRTAGDPVGGEADSAREANRYFLKRST